MIDWQYYYFCIALQSLSKECEFDMNKAIDWQSYYSHISLQSLLKDSEEEKE